MNIAHHVDTDFGVDFERARARLDADASRTFRQYHNAKSNPRSDDVELESLKIAYIEARNDFHNLKPTDSAAIAAIVGAGA